MSYNLNATDFVYDLIVNKIVSREWLPGSKIWSETKLCRQTGVSRTAVRQAIEKLAALSVLSKVHGSGTYVQSLQESSLSGLPFFQMEIGDILMLLEFRLYFEVGNVQMYIDRATDEDIAALEKNYASMCESAANSDRFYFLDNEFHNMIAEGTRNTYSIKVSNTFFEAMELSQLGLYKNLGPQFGLEWHGYILEFIKKRDKELASIYMRRHIELNIKALQDKTAKQE